MRTRLAAMTALDAQTHKDVDLFLTVAAGLLDEGADRAPPARRRS